MPKGMGAASQCIAVLALPFLFTLAVHHTNPGLLPVGLHCAVEKEHLYQYGGPRAIKCWLLPEFNAVVFLKCLSAGEFPLITKKELLVGLGQAERKIGCKERK